VLTEPSASYSLVSSPRYPTLPSRSCAYQSPVSSMTRPSRVTLSRTTLASMPITVLWSSVTTTSMRSRPSLVRDSYTQPDPAVNGILWLSMPATNSSGSTRGVVVGGVADVDRQVAVTRGRCRRRSVVVAGGQHERSDQDRDQRDRSRSVGHCGSVRQRGRTSPDSVAASFSGGSGLAANANPAPRGVGARAGRSRPTVDRAVVASRQRLDPRGLAVRVLRLSGR
jgi:hypothetical protein